MITSLFGYESVWLRADCNSTGLLVESFFSWHWIRKVVQLAKDINRQSWDQTHPTVTTTTFLHNYEVSPEYTAVINKLRKFIMVIIAASMSFLFLPTDTETAPSNFSGKVQLPKSNFIDLTPSYRYNKEHPSEKPSVIVHGRFKRVLWRIQSKQQTF